MGRTTEVKVAKPATKTTSARRSSNVQHASLPGENPGASIAKVKAHGDGEQQLRPRSIDDGSTLSGDGTGISLAPIVGDGTAQLGEAVEALSPVRVGPVDLARVQDRTPPIVSAKQRDLYDSIVAAKVYTRDGLLRLACTTAPIGTALEFGVYTGITLRKIRDYRKPKVFGFDSWQGLPEDWDTGVENSHPKGTFACQKPINLASGVHLVEGWFKDTIPEWLSAHQDDPRLIHIDCDLYSSTLDVLQGLDARIKAGTVLVFDELIDFAERQYPNWSNGEWKALVEWISDFGREVEVIGRTNHQQVAFIVKT